MCTAGRDCQCKHSPVFVSLSLSPRPELGKCSVSLILNGMDTNNIQSETSHFTSVTFSTLERPTRGEMSEMIYVFFPGKN